MTEIIFSIEKNPTTFERGAVSRECYETFPAYVELGVIMKTEYFHI